MVVLSSQSDKNSWSYSSQALGHICRRVAEHRGCQPTKGSSQLVGGGNCGAWAQEMRLDHVGQIPGRTAAGLC